MKLGKTEQERHAEEEKLFALIDAGNPPKRKKFAWTPVWCSNTKRQVWFEYYYEVTVTYGLYYPRRIYKQNMEIV